MTESMKMAEAEADAFAVGGMLETSIGSGPTTEKKSVVGNAAALREALKLFVEYSELVCRMGIFNRDRLIAITTKARDALAEPARNCDIYTTSKDADRAITEYCSKMAETGECAKSCPYRESEGGCAFGWLLATASERKGEGDGCD